MSSKGLSSIVGAVLLIMISVGAAASAWSFISAVTDQTKQNVQNRVDQQTRESQSELTSEIAYNGTDGHIIVTLRNTGSITLPLQEVNNGNTQKTLNLYVDGRPIDGDPKSWKFMSQEDGRVTLDPTESRPINTTASFPSPDSSKTLEFQGPYGTSTTYVCYSSGTASC